MRRRSLDLITRQTEELSSDRQATLQKRDELRDYSQKAQSALGSKYVLHLSLHTGPPLKSQAKVCLNFVEVFSITLISIGFVICS